RELQRRLLGVGLGAGDADEAPETAAPLAESPRGRSRGLLRVYVSNPTPPTRWSQPVPAAKIEAAARTKTGQPEASVVATITAVEARPMHRSGAAPVIVAGTLDTKGAELRFIRDAIAAAGVRTTLVDLSTSGAPSPADVPPHHVAAYHRGGGNAVFSSDRGA